MPGVHGTYMRYEDAGDMYVGRTVSGLPHDRHEFATLPPFFPRRPDVLDDAIASCFHHMPANLRYIAEMCLASIAYHRRFLRDTLPARHPVFQSPIFTQSGVLDELASAVECRLSTPTDSMRATGIPPHIANLIQSNRVLETLESQVLPAIANVPQTVVTGVADIIENRAVVILSDIKCTYTNLNLQI